LTFVNLDQSVYIYMSKKENRCIVLTPYGKIWGTIIQEYEEMGGPDDGAKFAIIELDNGQRITVQIKSD
jgi:hypothetical protein